MSSENIQFLYKYNIYKDPDHWPSVMSDKIKLTLIELVPIIQLTKIDTNFLPDKDNR